MARKAYEESNIAAIAAKIREKTGGSEGYKTSEMPAGIDKVYDKGVQDGKAQGGGGLTPSEGLAFAETWDLDTVMYIGLYGFTGRGDCVDTEIVVPCATHQGKPVVAMGYYTSDYNSHECNVSGISKIYLPDSVTTIYGIYGADNLTYVKFGRYTKEIKGNYFSDSIYPSNLVLDFSDFALSTPPTLEVGDLLGAAEKIIIPKDMGESFVLGTNWSAFANKFVDENGDKIEVNTSITNVTGLFSPMVGMQHCAVYESISISPAGAFDSSATCYQLGGVTAGQKYRVVCVPWVFSNLWENFIFPTSDGLVVQAIIANDDTVKQYVTNIDDTTYEIVIPSGCSVLIVNALNYGGFTAYLIE